MKYYFKYSLIFFSLIILFILIALPVQLKADNMIGHTEDNVISVYDENGKYIFGTAMGLSINDRYINENNIEYLILSINGKRAVAQELGKVNLLAGVKEDDLVTLTPLAAQGTKRIGIYHTHNGESYLPGPDNISGQGEIHQIGDVLKDALQKKGINVIQSDNLHLPHDGAAYERSRNTAADILKQRPDAIFDVHRDAIPRKEEYVTEINGKEVSQIRLVVGRQNPGNKVNDQFARRIKSISDKQYPGLIKGIFYGRGIYNQQISPHSLLLEFGSHVTTKEQAATSAEMLADSINQLLYGAGNQQQKGEEVENRTIMSTIFWIVLIVFIGLLAFLFINEGSVSGVINRIKTFFGREFIDRGDQ
ncbi:MAG: stage II sporulation protein P [Bacillota bacterium]